MPLIQGFSRSVVSANIAREMEAGRPQAQAVAIALRSARTAYRSRHPVGPFPKHLTMTRTYRASRSNRASPKKLVCRCGAYPFPHMPGGGSCTTNRTGSLFHVSATDRRGHPTMKEVMVDADGLAAIKRDAPIDTVLRIVHGRHADQDLFLLRTSLGWQEFGRRSGGGPIHFSKIANMARADVYYVAGYNYPKGHVSRRLKYSGGKYTSEGAARTAAAEGEAAGYHMEVTTRRPRDWFDPVTWYVAGYNYPKGHVDRRLKYSGGQFGSEEEARKAAAEGEAAGYYMEVTDRRPRTWFDAA